MGGAIRAPRTAGQAMAEQFVRATSVPPRPTLAQAILPERARRFWYGTQHVNDVVAVDTDGGNTRHFALQDANHNVVAFATNTTPSTVAQQYNYAPYGGLDFIEDGTGAPQTEAALIGPMLFAGMWRDPLTGDYCTPSGRCYDPDTGRWYQRDPNGLGFHMSTIPYYHGMTPMLSPYVSTRGHYADNPNPYGYARFNPNIYTDPMGYFSYGEILTTGFTYATMAYNWYSNAKSLFEMAQALHDGASLRNVAFDFVINVAADAAFGKSLDILAGAGSKLVGDFAEGFRKGAKKADDEIDKIRARANAKPEQEHHLIPKGEARFLKEYNDILSKYGMNVDSPQLPKVTMHHQGRHPTEYLQWVRKILDESDRFAQGDPQKFLAALESAAVLVQNTPEVLMKDFWR